MLSFEQYVVRCDENSLSLSAPYYPGWEANLREGLRREAAQEELGESGVHVLHEPTSPHRALCAHLCPFFVTVLVYMINNCARVRCARVLLPKNFACIF